MYAKKGAFFYLLWFAFVTASPHHWPIRFCNKNDPKINDCLLKTAKESLPVVSKGIRKMGLARLDPWKLGLRSLSASGGPVTLGVSVDEGVIRGLGNATLTSARLNKKGNKLIIESLHKKLIFSGKQDLTGTFLLYPLNSNGVFHGQVDNMRVTYTVHLNSTPAVIDMHMKSVEFIQIELTDNTLGYWGNAGLNKIVNDHWETFYDVIRPHAEVILGEELTQTFKPLLSQYSLDELLPSQ
ncbi:uncharacterized protein [Rhodnius prolixus]|uniref:uncharacterized protein n=1 Tax=Rhodnius prolixus TaxID=13249 RepID=UPI003D18C190